MMPLKKSVYIGDHQVSLYINEDRISHLEAFEILEAMMDAEGLSKHEAAERAVSRLSDASGEEALRERGDAWGVSDAEVVRESLRQYPVEELE